VFMKEALACLGDETCGVGVGKRRRSGGLADEG
jgi:hypothetical protein